MSSVQPLREIVPGEIWSAQQGLRFGPLRLTTRMTVVRLHDGSLWIHSPIKPEPSRREQLDRLGPVRYVVAPNKSHHLFYRSFLQAYPAAQGFVARGLTNKRPDLASKPVIPPAGPWSDELPSWFIEGLPVLNETVWFHRRSGTLLLTDLLFAFGREATGLTALVARLLGVRGRLGMSRTMKWAVADRQLFRRSVQPLLALPVERIVVAHDQVVEVDAAASLQRAFEWLDR